LPQRIDDRLVNGFRSDGAQACGEIGNELRETQQRVGSGGSDIGAHAYNSGTQAISDSTETTLTFDSERYDTDTIHDTSSNTGRLTCKTAGKYAIGACVAFAANGSNYRYAMIRLNGTTNLCFDVRPNSSGSLNCFLTPFIEWNMSVNDYVELRVWQNSGGSLNIQASGNPQDFWMRKVDKAG